MGSMMQLSKVADAIFEVVEPALRFGAHDLQVLTSNRPGNKDYHPSILDQYETGLVFQVFRHLIMLPALWGYEVRWEMPMQGKYVDLWLRHLDGGEPRLVESGDFTVQKVHEDLNKLRTLAPKSPCYFLAFFRQGSELGQTDPAAYIQKSFRRKNEGLDAAQVEYHPRYCRSISIVGPGGRTDVVGYSLLKGL